MALPTALVCWPLWVVLSGTPTDGHAILAAMHDRHAGTWSPRLPLGQHNTATRPDDSTEHSTWREYAARRGRLRIEFEPLDSGAGALYVRDSQFAFRSGRLTSATAFVHPLMVLGFDVYFDPAERTARRLEQQGFDLATVHEDTWDGRPAYVVGARRGGLRTRQFWGGKDRRPFVRLLAPGQRATPRPSDIRLN